MEKKDLVRKTQLAETFFFPGTSLFSVHPFCNHWEFSFGASLSSSGVSSWSIQFVVQEKM